MPIFECLVDAHLCVKWGQVYTYFIKNFKRRQSIFGDTQWQVTPQSVIKSGRISNSFELL